MSPETTTQTRQTIKDLEEVLTDSFTLYRRTHMAHWNVRGPLFHQLHGMFEEQYQEIWAALDVIAERIRALGGVVPNEAFAGAPVDGTQDAKTLVADLANGNRELAAKLRDVEAHANDNGDPGTADLAVERVRAHDQHAWMLEATAQDWNF